MIKALWFSFQKHLKKKTHFLSSYFFLCTRFPFWGQAESSSTRSFYVIWTFAAYILLFMHLFSSLSLSLLSLKERALERFTPSASQRRAPFRLRARAPRVPVARSRQPPFRRQLIVDGNMIQNELNNKRPTTGDQTISWLHFLFVFVFISAHCFAFLLF